MLKFLSSPWNWYYNEIVPVFQMCKPNLCLHILLSFCLCVYHQNYITFFRISLTKLFAYSNFMVSYLFDHGYVVPSNTSVTYLYWPIHRNFKVEWHTSQEYCRKWGERCWFFIYCTVCGKIPSLQISGVKVLESLSCEVVHCFIIDLKAH